MAPKLCRRISPKEPNLTRLGSDWVPKESRTGAHGLFGPPDDFAHQNN